MLQVARLAPNLLGESRELVSGFLRAAVNGDGGFADRAGQSDLYYTVFGLEATLALQEPTPASTEAFLRAFDAGGTLDFVHLTCLARAWACVSKAGLPEHWKPAVCARLESFRSGDGGFAHRPGAPDGSAYACFLGLGAHEDLGIPLHTDGLLDCLAHVRAGDGGYANSAAVAEGSTPATAAAVMVQHRLGVQPDPEVASWLLARAHPDGGFLAAPGAPIPDLLSTATALHALTTLHVDIGSHREPCLDFVDSLWTNRGGFYGHWADEAVDCEYTYYGLLALGHLSL